MSPLPSSPLPSTGCGSCREQRVGLEGVKAGEGKQECCRAWVADKPNNCF